MGQFYLTFYNWATGMQHVRIQGLTSQFDLETSDVDLAPSEQWLDQALVAGLGSMLRLVINYNEELNFGLEQQVDPIFDSYQETLGC